MKNIFFSLGLFCLLFLGLSSNNKVYAIDNLYNDNYQMERIENAYDSLTADFGEIDESMLQLGEELEQFFELNSDGLVNFQIDVENLSQTLNISLDDARDIIEASENFNILEPINMHSRGFVGIYINLGSRTRKMNGWAAGAFAAGYVGWYAKQFAVAGPVGAGVAGVITAATGVSVKWAVTNGIRRVPVGKYIGGWNWYYSINLP